MLELLKAINWPVLYGTVLIIWLTLMLWYKKFPSAESMNEFAAVINSRGGNILLLAALSMYFFAHSMRLFYLLLDLSKGGYVQQDNAFALMGLQFATSSAFGGSFGAMLKTMNGESTKGRSSDNGGPNATFTIKSPPPSYNSR